MSGELSTYVVLMDHIPPVPVLLVRHSTPNRIVHVLEEFMLEAGATKGRDLRSEVSRIRSFSRSS
jgi:hypothetical protein